MINVEALFKAIRRIKGSGLTQAEVDLVNAALEGVEPSGRISDETIAMMHEFESIRLRAYPDPGSRDGTPWTIGWGSTGPDIKRGTVWTREQSDARFKEDLEKFALGVDKLLNGAATTPKQFEAMVSLAYNIGLGAFAGSTLLRKHLAGDYAGAQRAFASWKYNDGKVMNGLVRRRAAEAALYGDKT